MQHLLLFAELQVELREITLKNKPAPMLTISPKGTVPLLELPNSRVIDESREILEWALAKNDPSGLLDADLQQAADLMDQNDGTFKHWLDRYKYADRHPEMSPLEYRQNGEVFLQVLERLLADRPYLLGDAISIADISIMPFVRQFAHVDRQTFYLLPYPRLQQWLLGWLEHPMFLQAMTKFEPWQEGDEVVVLSSETAY